MTRRTNKTRLTRNASRLAAALAVILSLGACSGNNASGVSDDLAGAPVGTDAGAAPTAPVAEVGGDVPQVRASFDQRKVIRTGQIQIHSTDTRAAMDAIATLVVDGGGYVSSAEVSPTNGNEDPVVVITIRVPTGDLDTALVSIRKIADEVVSESIQSQDVTEEYTDIEAQLTNLTLLETELRALLADVREQPNADPAKLLQVYNEISRVRGEAEILEGRRRLIDNQTALSTLSVTITPLPIDAPLVDDTWKPLLTARNALGNLVDAIQSLTDAAIWLLVFVVPVLAILSIPVWILVFILRRRHRRTAQRPPVETAVAEPDAKSPVDSPAP